MKYRTKYTRYFRLLWRREKLKLNKKKRKLERQISWDHLRTNRRSSRLFLFAVSNSLAISLLTDIELYCLFQTHWFFLHSTTIFVFKINRNRDIGIVANAPLFVPKVDNVTRLGRVPNLLMCITWTFLLHTTEGWGEESNFSLMNYGFRIQMMQFFFQKTIVRSLVRFWILLKASERKWNRHRTHLKGTKLTIIR